MCPYGFGSSFDTTVHPSTLPDNEKCFEPHDDMPGGKIMPSTSLLLFAADNFSLEKL
jgi:hypothetical protein